MMIQVLAPAKVNLGLEVIRKRDDGFHDIATVFQSISVFDHMRLTAAPADRIDAINRFEHIEANLLSRALSLARERGITNRCWQIELEKRIPIAAGLGGASADAAGTVLALSEFEGFHDRDALSSIALQLGSDVPFLLQGGAALAHGRGEQLEPVPSLKASWLVLASPVVEIERKTAQLYGALRPGDFSDGSRVERVAASLRAHRVPDATDLFNTFRQPLAERFLEVAPLHRAFQHAGAPFAALSGAGPTHYTIVSELDSALRIARQLAQERPMPMRILVARPTAAGPLTRVSKTTNPHGTL